MPETTICHICLQYFDSSEVTTIFGDVYCKTCQKKWEKKQTKFNRKEFNEVLDRKIQYHYEQIELCNKQRACRHRWTSPYSNWGDVECRRCGVGINGEG